MSRKLISLLVLSCMSSFLGGLAGESHAGGKQAPVTHDPRDARSGTQPMHEPIAEDLFLRHAHVARRCGGRSVSGVMLYLTSWFGRQARPRASGYFLLGVCLTNVVGGPLGGALLEKRRLAGIGRFLFGQSLLPGIGARKDS